MATPTVNDVISTINAYIVANGNNEITANVLNPILILLADFGNNNMGNLSTLNTTEQNNLVGAINEIYNLVSNITNGGIQLHEGNDNPNDVPPSSYNIADFYIEKDVSNNPIQLWQYNGIEWVKANGTYLTSSAYPDTKYPYVDSNNFTIPTNVQAISVRKNGGPTEVYGIDWTQLGNVITYNGTLVADDYLIIGGVFVVPSAGGGGGVSIDTIATTLNITLDQLGLTSEDEVTPEILAAYINTLGLTKSETEFYIVRITESFLEVFDLTSDTFNTLLITDLT